MKLLPSPHNKNNRSAIIWALLSQSIWLPIFVSGSQDELSGGNGDYHSFHKFQSPQQAFSGNRFQPSAQTLISGRRPLQSPRQRNQQNTGIVLNSVLAGQHFSSLSQSSTLVSASTRNATEAPPPPMKTEAGVETSEPRLHSERPIEMDLRRGSFPSANFIQKLYSRSELLGGTVTLQDLSEPLMPPLARAERAQWSRSGDPLAPLPQMWREPMRKALQSLAQEGGPAKADTSGGRQEVSKLDPARFVHVPSSKIRQASEVPLALQADGTVDILNQPDDPAVIDEINRWSAKQKLPAKGTLSPAVVHLHPMQPVDIGRSTSETTTSSSPSQTRATEAAAVPLPPPLEVITPAAPVATGNEAPASAATITPAPITSAVSQPASKPDPAPPSEAGS